MGDDISAILAGRAASAERPLMGLTVLVVEDSRFACEAMRLLCLRSGARIRRADCLRSAHRHLQTYRPAVVIVDLGLPDGSGVELIADLAALPDSSTVLLGCSGEAAGEAAALAAGADGFLLKPVENLATFQSLILGAMAPALRPQGLGAVSDAIVQPDPLALRDDLAHAVELLGKATDAATIAYVSNFLAGIALGAHDPALKAAANALAEAQNKGKGTGPGLARISGLVRDRLATGAAF
ncbi:MAG: response regulator [Phaeovulum sp.]|uniref:response regulator n=1 Tax=Phaeovulum sp. TaxID=2934796 RepID=UPI00273631A4|nr:response regulator [Phaeovulum sp.]MDP3862321.1 response regulator [Phaeovulum sp.]